MKTPLLALCFALAGAMQAAAPMRSVIWVDVKETANDSRRKNNYPTTWGSYHDVYSGYKELVVKLHNSASSPATIGVQAIFIGRAVGGGLRVVSNQQQVLDVDREDVTWPFRADFAGEDLNLVLVPSREMSGTRSHGWVVQVWQGGKVIARKASLPELEKWIEENPIDPRAAKNPDPTRKRAAP
ncbi:MAG: hypothetical protein HZA93_23755 [Verrucomicrobia bacterium]|nr:hypothetical protein [Verrucomicrobiota bacterium]